MSWATFAYTLSVNFLLDLSLNIDPLRDDGGRDLLFTIPTVTVVKSIQPSI